MRPTLKSTAVATLIGGCAAAGIAVASASTPHDGPEHAPSPISATHVEPGEHTSGSESARRTHDQDRHRGHEHSNSPASVPAAHTEHATPEPGDDNGGARTEPGDDNGGARTEPGDDNGGARTEPGDDRGRHGSDSGTGDGGDDNRGPGGDDNSAGPIG